MSEKTTDFDGEVCTSCGKVWHPGEGEDGILDDDDLMPQFGRHPEDDRDGLWAWWSYMAGRVLLAPVGADLNDGTLIPNDSYGVYVWFKDHPGDGPVVLVDSDS